MRHPLPGLIEYLNMKINQADVIKLYCSEQKDIKKLETCQRDFRRVKRNLRTMDYINHGVDGEYFDMITSGPKWEIKHLLDKLNNKELDDKLKEMKILVRK